VLSKAGFDRNSSSARFELPFNSFVAATVRKWRSSQLIKKQGKDASVSYFELPAFARVRLDNALAGRTMVALPYASPSLVRQVSYS